jgi:hypothetical protein
MFKKPFVCFLTLFVGFQPSLSSPPERGILVSPIKTNGGYVGEAGQIVNYSYVDSRKLDIWVTLNDTMRFNVFEHYVIPYDSIFSPSRIYLLLLEDPFQVIGTQDIIQQARFRYTLTKNACQQFPSNPLHEYFCAQLVRYTTEYFNEEKGKPMQAIAAAKAYLQEFPRGKFKDEVEWRLIQLENQVYEYEGFAAEPLAQMRVYEGYLGKNPKSQVADQIKLHLAYLCRVITESLDDDLEKNAPDGFVKEDIQKYREKALGIYHQLLGSNDQTVRETARVAIYNIEHGRTAYVGATDW